MSLRHLTSTTLAVALAFALAPAAAQDAEPAPDTPAEAGDGGESRIPLDEIRRYVAVYSAIKAAYVEPVNDEELMHSAIRGLLLDLDPHSAYLEGDDAESFEEQSRGNYDGIGVEIFRQPDGTLRVIAPIDDTPAARAGVKAGGIDDVAEYGRVPLNRIAWLTTVGICLIISLILLISGYLGYAGVLLAIALAAAINLR